jgi:hypothetical protein
MLPLDDPLWQKLDDAHRDRSIPDVLSRLAESWNTEAANSLLWDCLCHQGTCYGATYAAIPHLLNIAQLEENQRQRLEIALFAGYVALRARDLEDDANRETPHLSGLPDTLDAWEQKRDVYRYLVASLENPGRPGSLYEQAELLPRCRNVLAVDPVDTRDLEKIRSIGAEFVAALPSIRALCERAFLENSKERDGALYLLCGIAACDGLLDVAGLLESGLDEGAFRCSSCERRYRYLLFGDRVAVYVDKSDFVRDYRDHAPSRTSSFMTAARDQDITDRRAAALLSLAARAPSPKPAALLRNLLGSFHCDECDARGPIRAA